MMVVMVVAMAPMSRRLHMAMVLAAGLPRALQLHRHMAYAVLPGLLADPVPDFPPVTLGHGMQGQ